jgi:catechol 2,3-dioxygenase-like lactoylglutathione lyase family enzyme
MTLEVVVLGVSDVGRAKAFYEKLGWRLDAGRARAADRASRRLLSDFHFGFGQGITSDQTTVRRGQDFAGRSRPASTHRGDTVAGQEVRAAFRSLR